MKPVAAEARAAVLAAYGVKDETRVVAVRFNVSESSASHRNNEARTDPPLPSDGFFYVEDTLREDDRMHESEEGQDNVGRKPTRFFQSDPISRGRFVSSSVR